MVRYFNYNNILKRTLLVLLVLCIGVISNLSGFIVNAAEPEIAYEKINDNELRGVWIATVFNINFPSKPGISADQMKTEIDDIIENCKEANLNAIFFQVRPTGDALYDSAIFPTSKYLTGKQGDPFVGGFDPLRYIIEEAHKNNIELHAWVNPYRITNASAASPEQDLNALAPNNPARMNPSWVVKYDGKLFYNPGLPEVQELITNGITEIVRKYDVDGIHFDDYFYPYPVAGVNFDDDAAYKKHGTSYNSIGDFRRASVNKLVENVYKEIKKINPEVRFGISPFGIWANQSDKTPTGSKTGGLESYYSIYSDAKAWVNGGYIDYICPQIYWSFTTKVAPFDVLVRWWSALVDGTGVDLYIGHAAYRVSEWDSDRELPRQVEYARSYMGVAGSVFYGYKDLIENSYDIKTNLAKLFAEPRKIVKPVSNDKSIEIGRPLNNATVTDAAVNMLGSSNPAYPVYYKGEKLTRTKGGFFSVYAPLNDGKNSIEFTQNNVKYTHTVTKGKSASAGSSGVYVYPQMDSYKIEVIRPTTDIVTTPGDKIIVRVQAPSKSTVTAQLRGTTVNLLPLTEPPDEGTYMTEVYQGTIYLPNTQPNGQMIDLGNITYTAARGNETASVTGINIKLINESAYRPCQVINDNAYVKISTTSSFYDDYLPASVGMRDNVVGFQDGYYKLGFGGWIHSSNVVLLPEKTLLVNRILSVAMENKGTVTEIRFGITENVPVNAKCKDGVFTVTLYNTPDGGRQLTLVDNPIFKTVKISQNKERKSVTYTFDLIDPDNWYGFEVVYEGGFIILKVKNPMKKIEGDLPLDGFTILVDAGHGGPSDSGAAGFMRNRSEKDLNLDVALATRDKLISLGANVIMTRVIEETVDIYYRMDWFNAVNPDLLISIHHNSVGDAYDISLVRGFESRYCNESGRALAKICSKAITKELNRVERATLYQMLAVLRNHKFPATLFEMSFVSNPDEYEFAQSAEANKRSAEGIAQGILDWIDFQQQFVK